MDEQPRKRGRPRGSKNVKNPLVGRDVAELKKELGETPEGTIDVPLPQLRAMSTTDQFQERYARGVLLGAAKGNKSKELRQNLQEKVTERIGKKGKYLTDKLFELIEGVYIVDKERSRDEGQEVRYYKVPPNFQAIAYALDRVLGKPTQVVEKTEEKKGLILVEHVIKQLAQPKIINQEPGNGIPRQNESTQGQGMSPLS